MGRLPIPPGINAIGIPKRELKDGYAVKLSQKQNTQNPEKGVEREKWRLRKALSPSDESRKGS